MRSPYKERMKPNGQKQENQQSDQKTNPDSIGSNGEIDAKMCVRRFKNSFVISIKLDNALLARLVNSFIVKDNNQGFYEESNTNHEQSQEQNPVGTEKVASFQKCTSLTDRECEILTRLSTGMLNKEIADEMGLSINTVKNHLQNIYSKLCVENRTEAILRYFDRLARKDNSGV